MRTTVTLDADVERLLKTTARQRGKSFKVVLNDAVRQSLGPKKSTKKPVLLPAHSLKLRPEIDPLRLSQLADELEVEAYLSTTRQLMESFKVSEK